MKRTWLVMSLLLVACFAQAEVTYHLEKVNSIVDGGRYVFVKNGRAVTISAKMVSSTGDNMPTTPDYKTSQLSGNEEYVWTAVKMSSGFRLLNSGSGTALNYPNNNESKFNLVNASVSSTAWKFQNTTDSIRIWTNDSTKYIGLTNKSSTAFYVCNGPNTSVEHPSRLALFRLDLDNYERVLTSQQIGTICLPFTTDEAVGADFYEIAYKEVDKKGDPINVCFQLMEGPLQAGHAYLFMPTSNTISCTPVADSYVSAPVSKNGLKGTFVVIQDQETSKSSNKLEGKYMINSEGKIQLCGTGCSLNAYRAYINMENVPVKDAVAAPVRRMLVIGPNSQPEIIEPGAVTGTWDAGRTTQSNRKMMNNGQLVIISSKGQYNAQGGRL